jgi:Fic family protein
VPPPADRVMACMGELEKFLHEERGELPPLIKAGLVHVQFETIHPFLDGNGRLGRLLITFLLCAAGALKEPTLYLSLYFKSHRQAYYDLLTRVRETGDWEAWLAFFLGGVKETSEQAIEAARRILALLDADRRKIEALGRPAASVLRVFQHAQTSPILSIQAAAKRAGVSFPTASQAVAHMQKLGILREITRKRRHRLFAYEAYMAILNEGTERLA